MTKKKTAKPVDPRIRMLEVRADVKTRLKSDNFGGVLHLGLVPKNLSDARRYIVALQDLLEDSTGRHDLATAHVEELNAQMKHVSAFAEYQSALIKHAHQMAIRKEEQAVLQAEDREVEFMKLSSGWDASMIEALDAKAETKKLQLRVDALLSTIAILSEGSI